MANAKRRRLDVGALDACLDQFLIDAPNAPGVIARVEGTEGVSWTGARGVADRVEVRPMHQSSTFRMASNTKTFCAAAILRLAEQGSLRIEDKVERFLPQDLVVRLSVIDGTSYGNQITILNLLQHTSGLHVVPDERGMEFVVRHPSKRWTPREGVEWVMEDGPPSFRPGCGVEYCDPGYVLLAMIIEEVCGQPLAASFRSLLRFAELGLNVVHLESLEPEPADAGPRVRQYLDEIDTTDFDPSFDLWGAGGLVSDVADLAGFWHALFGQRVFDSPATLRRMCETVHAHNGEVWDRSGLGVFSRKLGPRRVWWHGGFWGTAALHEPTIGLTIAVAANQSSAREPALRRLQERLLRTASA